jgi:hypothetical protein
MIKIILASESKIKEDAVKQWFKKSIKKDLVFIKKVNVSDSLLPPQPINTGGILICSDRIKFVEKNIPNIQDYEYIISIENCLKIRDNKILDCVYIKIKDILLDCEYSANGGDVEITYKFLKDYPKLLNITDDLIKNYEETNKKYIFDGCEITFGELINKYYPNIPAKNWMKKLCNLNRKDQILSVLEKITYKFNSYDKK